MSNAGKEQIDKEITALAALNDADIDTSEIPEVTDWSRAAVGRFYDPDKRRVTILVDVPTWLPTEDLQDNRAVQTSAAGQKSAKRFWSFGSLPVQWRAAVLTGLACSIVVLVAFGVRGGWIRGSAKHRDGTVVSNGGEKPTDRGDVTAFPEIAALSSDEQPAVWKAINSGNISYPSSLSDLRGRLGPLRHESSEGKALQVLEPVGEVVTDPRPLFRWHPVAGAVAYSVVIFGTKANRVQTGSAGRSTRWKPAHPLQRGHV
jgi:hypothetical protein